MRTLALVLLALAINHPVSFMAAPAINHTVLFMAPSPAQDAVDFDREIRPILEARCLKCHGHEKRKGGLLLTSRKGALQLGDSGLPALVPGKPQESQIFRRITSTNDDDRMPPSGKALTAAEVALLRRWIESGASWAAEAPREKHWAYVKAVRPAVPAVGDGAWPIHDLDKFILERLEAEGLRPSPPADRARLIRRVSLDLTGLPPSVEEVDAFVGDGSPDAYEKVVDQLLASPRFGEHWARHWLDLGRYADSNGFQADQFRESWAFRDWVIDAMNADMPFDRFTIEQIAGDLLPDATPAQRVATGFHRATTCNVEAGVDPEENRVNQVIDRVNTTATVWLGSTLECAQCHNHKYDPFTQVDYYRFFAFFNGTPLEVKQRAGVTFDFVGPTMTLPMAPQRRSEWEGLQRRLEDLERERAKRPAPVADAWKELAERLRRDKPKWTVLETGPIESTGGEDFTVLEDKSVLVGGVVPGSSTYTVTLPTTLERISAFKLETLTHSSLPGNGPGRGDDQRPNFILSEFAVATAEGATVEIHSAKADYSQPKWDIEKAIDGDQTTGWAIAEQFAMPHWATFRLKAPFAGGPGTTLVFTLDQNYGRGRTIGRFRLSALTGSAEAVDLSNDVVKMLLKERPSPKEIEELRKLFPGGDPETRKLDEAIAAVKREMERIQPPTTLVMVEMGAPRMTNLLKRGNFLDKGAEVRPGVPEGLHPLPADAPPNRLGLARWLIDRENPLVARVTVNRWWSQIFGHGLVRTPEDFGIQGEKPTHPKLLDWLAVEFMDSGWSMKRLLRRIVTSATYRQSSRIPPAVLEKDPQNFLYARGPRVRLAAENIRDSALAASGLLSNRTGGPPVMPHQPAGLWRTVGRNEPKWIESAGEDRYRRGIYVVWRRAAPYPSFVNFDASDRASCVVERPRTNTPLQALTLLNDPAYVETALALAGRMLDRPGAATDEAKAEYGFRLCVSRAPSAQEVAALVAAFRRERDRFARAPQLARELVAGVKRWQPAAGTDPVALAAWFSVANVLLNLDETITKG
jgi:hypothetical protein